jgi:signal transduction histidine kinase
LVPDGYVPRRPLASLPEEFESGLVNLTGRTVLVMVPPDDIPMVRPALEELKLIPIPASDAADIIARPRRPTHAIVAPELPGALDVVRNLAAPSAGVLVLAILPSGQSESAALRAGAAATLGRPLDPADVSAHLQRFQRYADLVTSKRELFERGEANIGVGAVARVASAVGHEIRNPLAAVRMNVACLRARTMTAKDRDAALADTEHALERIESTLAALSKLARGQKPECGLLELARIARDAIAEVPNARGVPIEVDADPSTRGLANEVLLRQVIVNLVSNALDAMSGSVPGGQSPRVIVRVYSTPGEARISVRDWGPGIPRALRDRLFEPFFTTKGDKGSGLGLAISHQAVGSMGGALTLAADSTTGACFRVRLRRE